MGRIGLQPSGLKTRRVDGGYFVSFAAGRIGRDAKFPPQLGQTPPSLFSTQSRQNVHSNVQIIASVADGGRSLSQHSQLGRNSSMSSPPIQYDVLSLDHPHLSTGQRLHHSFGPSAIFSAPHFFAPIRMTLRQALALGANVREGEREASWSMPARSVAPKPTRRPTKK
jgi:hypothetical protein